MAINRSNSFVPPSISIYSLTVLCDSKSDLSFEELTKLASDPVAFEAYALGKRKMENKKNDSPEPSKLKSAYVPIEQWDAERSKDDFSWEERIQFDGRRHGDQFRQNEILRHNLNGL